LGGEVVELTKLINSKSNQSIQQTGQRQRREFRSEEEKKHMQTIINIATLGTATRQQRAVARNAGTFNIDRNKLRRFPKSKCVSILI
jgi:hypothetical protein